MSVVLILLALVGGIIILSKGSDWMTDSLIPVAEKLGTTYIAVAPILVSIMLSIPEIVVALYSFFMGHQGISLGVIIGSIICNIGLMTGLSAMIKPLAVDARVVIRDGIYAFVIALVVFLLGYDRDFDRADGIILMLLFIPYILNVWFFEKWASTKFRKAQQVEIQGILGFIGLDGLELKPSVMAFILGCVTLILGSYLFSYALVSIAEMTKLSDIIIGLTIGALGPSIPNIVSAIQGTLKNYTKVAITETFGSDIFTLLITLGVLATIMPFSIDVKWLRFDIPMMLFMNLLMLLFIFKGRIKKEQAIMRSEGLILVLCYIGIVVLNVLFMT